MSFTEVVSGLAVYSLQVALILGLALPLPRLLGLRSPRLKLAFYHLLLAIVLILPAAGLFPVARTGYGFTAEFQIGTIIADSATSSRASMLMPMLVFGTALVAVARLIRICCGLLALAHFGRNSLPLRLTPALFQRLERRMVRRVTIRSTSRLKSPAAFGWRKPTILVPSEFLELNQEQQEAIIFHELLHLKRKDWPVALLEQSIRAVLWFHPLVSILVDRIQLAREQVVDREVVRITGRPQAYLETLGRAAEAFRQASAVPTTPFIRASHLKHRVDLLTQEVCMTRSRQFVTGLTLVSSALLLSAVTLSAFPSRSLAARFPEVLSVSSGSASLEARSERESSKQETKGNDPVVLSEESAVQAKLIKQVSPVYPEEAKAQGIHGKVVSKVRVDEQGKVVDVTVEQSPDERLSQATAEALRQWEWEPLVRDGKAVSFLLTISVNFALQ